MMYDKVILIGNLTRDPEMRYTDNGVAVTNLSVATNRKWKGADGVQHEQVVWWRVSVWGAQAEPCQQYLSTGRQVFIEGQVVPDENGNPRMWERNDGSMETSFELRALSVKFLGSKGGASQQTTAEDSLPF